MKMAFGEDDAQGKDQSPDKRLLMYKQMRDDLLRDESKAKSD